MIFLLIRIFPFLFPICYLALAKSVFYFSDWWRLILFSGAVLLSLYFLLLKLKNRQKQVGGLLIFSLILYLSGISYLLILENVWIVNSFLILWSGLFWFYLEAVFHDFYDTKQKHIMNLQNISLYGNILIIFFLTASFSSFNLFLNWPKLAILLVLGLAYLSIIHFSFSRQGIASYESWLYSAIIALVLLELLVALMYLPASFYVISVILSIIYYFFSSIAVLSLKKLLTAKAFWSYLTVCIVLGLIVILTGSWI